MTGGCGGQRHLTYDFGRSYTNTFMMQSDRSRASVADTEYVLYGPEGTAIRMRVEQSSTDTETEEVSETSGK